MKHYKPSKRAEIYIKKMISRGTWPENKQIPSLLSVSKKLEISYPVILKVIKQFVKDGTINNSFGYFVNSKKLNILYNNSKNKYYRDGIISNLSIYELLRNGGKEFSNGWIINIQNYNIRAINKFSRQEINTDINEVNNVLNNIITSAQVLKNISLKEKYNRQREIYSVCITINKFKKELNL